MEQLGFWSYVHADDDMSMGRATALGRDIVSNYESIRAESIELFLDRDDLKWGDKWRHRVNESLSNVAFFIPVISPRYFLRPECRREFQFFLDKSKSLGIRELILPILWIDVPELKTEGGISDSLVAEVRDIQWEDWTQKRFLDRETGAYQQAVFDLATELVRRASIVERADIVTAVQAAEDGADDDEPGLLDRVAALEETMPRWTDTISALTAEIGRIAQIMNDGNESMQAGEARGKGFAARLTVARQVANTLMDPVEAIEGLSQSFVSDLVKIDSGVKALIEQAPDIDQQAASPEEVAVLDEAFTSIRGLGLTTLGAKLSVEEMIKSAEPLERQSKDMRKPLRLLRKSLTSMVEAQQIAGEWSELMDANNLGDPLEAAAIAERRVASAE